MSRPCSGSFTFFRSQINSVKCCEMRPHEDQFNTQPFADVTAKAAHSLQLFKDHMKVVARSQTWAYCSEVCPINRAN